MRLRRQNYRFSIKKMRLRRQNHKRMSLRRQHHKKFAPAAPKLQILAPQAQIFIKKMRLRRHIFL
jgi:hypothetical protein